VFKSNLQIPLTQNDSELLELVIGTEEVQKTVLLNTYLEEKTMSMEDTVERLEHRLRVLQDLNRGLATIELYIEKVEHICYLLDDLVAQERALRR
jgi:hypothetical protein